jgi:hypothetical protein
MDAKELIMSLIRLESPSPDLDREIALSVGYSSRPGAKDGEMIWTSKSKVDVLKLPLFTASVHEAMELARSLNPLGTVACSWEEGAASAKIDAYREIQARLPAPAICAAIIFSLVKGR